MEDQTNKLGEWPPLPVLSEDVEKLLVANLDPVLRSNLGLIAREVWYNDFDWLFLISGGERTGKSDLENWLAKFFQNRGFHFSLDPEKKHLLLFEKSLSNVLLNLPRHSVVCIDEGGEVLFSRESMKRNNVEIIKTLQAMGAMGHIVIICLPNWRWVDKYVRQQRVKTLIRVISHPKRVGDFVTRERGFYRFYNQKQVVYATKFNKPLGRPPFAGRYSAFKSVFPADWKEYLDRKWSYLAGKAEVEQKKASKKHFGNNLLNERKDIPSSVWVKP